MTETIETKKRKFDLLDFFSSQTYDGEEEQKNKKRKLEQPEKPKHVENPKSVLLACDIPENWNRVKEALNNPIETATDLKNVILGINPHKVNKWNFSGLIYFLESICTQEENQFFFKNIIPFIVKFALEVPQFSNDGEIPLLVEGTQQTIKLSQREIVILLSNSFFCTFPLRNSSSSKFGNFPSINFNTLYSGTHKKCTTVQAAKLRCIINYFKRVIEREINENKENKETRFVTFHRRCLSKFPKWNEKKEQNFFKFYCHTDGTIEDDTNDSIQVDFANKSIGGGVLTWGSVQEEIRFLICTELIVSRLFCETITENECIIITGSERFNDYSGYAEKFEYFGNFKDETAFDQYNRINTKIVALDAQKYYIPDSQWKEKSILRELNKAYCGFRSPETDPNPKPIATGLWGCGVFNGNPELKTLIQWMAASLNRRDIHFYTFGSEEFTQSCEQLTELILKKKFSIGDTFDLIIQYSDLKQESEAYSELKLFDFITAFLKNPKEFQELLELNIDTESKNNNNDDDNNDDVNENQKNENPKKPLFDQKKDFFSQQNDQNLKKKNNFHNNQNQNNDFQEVMTIEVDSTEEISYDELKKLNVLKNFENTEEISTEELNKLKNL